MKIFQKSDIYFGQVISLSKLLCEVKQYSLANGQSYLPKMKQNSKTILKMRYYILKDILTPRHFGIKFISITLWRGKQM